MSTWNNQSTQTQDKTATMKHKAVEKKKEAGGLGGAAPQQVVDPVREERLSFAKQSRAFSGARV